MAGKMRGVTVAVTVIFSSAGGIAHADDMRIGGTGAATGILQRLVETFSASNPADSVDIVTGLGSSGGIAATTEGALNLSVSGRPLKNDEKAKGLDGMPFIDTPFIFVTSHPRPMTLEKSDVLAIYNGELTRWPDGKEIKPILRPRSDAVSGYLIANFAGMQSAMDKLRQRPDVPVAATDQDNAEAAEKIANSFTAMTLLQFLTERRRLNVIAMDGIEPSVEHMQNGTYSLKTTLHLVTGAQPPAIAQRFMAFIRTQVAEKLVRESGGVLVFARSASIR